MYVYATKSLQLCPTLCNSIDGSPPGSPVPGILQARTLEWVAISFSNAWKLKVKVKSLSRVRLFPTPWTAAYQAPPSMGFPRQEYWSGVPLPSPLWRPTRPFRTNTPKKCPFHYRGLECKSRKSRNTWSNRQIWPWNTEWSRAKANRILPRECIGHSKHPIPTTEEKTLHMDITRWSTPKSDWLYYLQPKMEKLYIVSKNKTGSWLWLRSWTPYCQIQT